MTIRSTEELMMDEMLMIDWLMIDFWNCQHRCVRQETPQGHVELDQGQIRNSWLSGWLIKSPRRDSPGKRSYANRHDMLELRMSCWSIENHRGGIPQMRDGCCWDCQHRCVRQEMDATGAWWKWPESDSNSRCSDDGDKLPTLKCLTKGGCMELLDQVSAQGIVDSSDHQTKEVCCWRQRGVVGICSLRFTGEKESERVRILRDSPVRSTDAS
jgi:hypothetical protein